MVRKVRRCRKGVTLMELVVAILVFSIILVATTSVFQPILQAHLRSTDFAEANTLLDNIATLVMESVNNSQGFAQPEGRLGVSINPPDPNSALYGLTQRDYWEVGTTAQGMTFRINSGGVLEWRIDGPGGTPGNWYSVIDPGFYVNKNLLIGWTSDSGLVTVIIRLEHDQGWWQMERAYAARPLGMI
ncbi:MAG: prepilin-type N-terminal cleavage/methylation domain-containing protein [Defluviitaleaceae bacterium]|nr:prepilin-type N-terminal cleavage/methylation domain-containing protein [Defluviitaleaceae bacterium]